MERLSRVVGPARTNVHLLADERSREAIAVDTAIPSLAWVADALAERGWVLRLIVSTHRHWDHIGDNAAVQAHTGAPIAVHALDRPGLEAPRPLWAPFEIPPCVPAVELEAGGMVRFGGIALEVLHTPGHTEGSICLLDRTAGLLLSGDTLLRGAFGRVDLPGGDPAAMVESIGRLAGLADGVRVAPGHGPETTIGEERRWMSWIARERRLPI
jgi:hydroxyacylglutathione hydrolase